MEEEEEDDSSVKQAVEREDSLNSLEDRRPVYEINTSSFEELALEPHVVHDAQAAWSTLLAHVGSFEAAGEAIYSTLFENAPTLQNLFTTPRGVQAMRFVTTLHSTVLALGDPAQLKVLVETLGFGHLNLEVTIPRAVVFRDAILDLLEVELEEHFTMDARDGWMSLLNYIAGAFIFLRSHYADRLRVLAESWCAANRKTIIESKAAADDDQRSVTTSEQQEQALEEEEQQRQLELQQQQPKGWRSWRLASQGARRLKARQSAAADKEGGGIASSSLAEARSPQQGMQGMQAVPTTFFEMFQFNAAVMGFSSRSWMKEVLASFDTMVTHAGDTSRLQQECDVLALRISRAGAHGVNLAEFKSCMLASLRSLLPKEWNSSHEVAWNWFWENVEHLLRQVLGRPPAWEKSLAKLWEDIDDDQRFELRRNIYERFFAAAPNGQDFFKQSTTRLHFIADKILMLTLELLRDPWRVVDEISALGLRHVGYGIPVELFGPYVSATIQAVGAASSDAEAVGAFRWSLALTSNILVRTINEGSTIVMRAINVNSTAQLVKAISCAPRGERAKWLLLVQVGTQSISPLSWAIESGSLDAADAILQDLLTIRADRDRYYYGVDELFHRHPDVIHRLIRDAPSLLPTLLEGLVWRARDTKDGRRRVNYYVKHLLIDSEGRFSDALKHVVAFNDPKIISHPVIILVSDTLWTGFVRHQFISARIWFILSLTVMMLSQAVLPKLQAYDRYYVRIITLIGRAAIYGITMIRLFAGHVRESWIAYRHQETTRCGCIRIPTHLRDPYQASGLVLAVLLLLMCTHEPMLYCLGSSSAWPTGTCQEAEPVEFRYSFFCMIAMGLHWLMLMELAVFNTGLTAFLLVIVNVMAEIGRFLVALSFLLLMFASAISVLEHTYDDMSDVPKTAIALFAITVSLYEDDYRDFQEDPVLLAAVFAFVTSSAVLLLNLLIAQLNCTYVYIYQNMVGFARLRRAEVIVSTLATCPMERWTRFVQTLGLDRPLEFNEGDVGISGGLQVSEPANAHVVAQDSILRFGGSSSADLQWPEDAASQEEDRFERMERLLKRTLKRISARGQGSSSSGYTGSSAALSDVMSGTSDG